MTATVLDAIIPVLSASYFSDYEYLAKCPLCDKNYVSLGIVKSLDWLTICCNKCSYNALVKYLANKYNPIIQYNVNNIVPFKYWYADSDPEDIKNRAILVDNAMAAAALVSYGFGINFGFNVISYSDSVDLDSLKQHSELYIWATNNKDLLSNSRKIYNTLLDIAPASSLFDVRYLPLNSNPAHFNWYDCLRLINYHVLINSMG